jgi:hypothetical protein
MTPGSQTPPCLRRLRWPLAAAFLAVLGTLVAMASLPDGTPLEAHGGWLTGALLILGILGLSAWTAPPLRAPSRNPRM